MESNENKLYTFIQQKYLWQFYSRDWDREKNINGIIDAAKELLTTGKSTLGDSLQDKYFYSEAKILADDMKRELKFLYGLNDIGLVELMDSVKAKLIDVTITNSLNGELNVEYY